MLINLRIIKGKRLSKIRIYVKIHEKINKVRKKSREKRNQDKNLKAFNHQHWEFYPVLDIFIQLPISEALCFRRSHQSSSPRTS
ncbi:predicted protein [Methanosarcina acetivorans C2A]|uniref:Uncharacterized protein n=1 Tax=Methanosarcina acetivorans (strain ATCC 35395 / DSM 2834 / JCM 12185 / C2A) TaxID=188937 RepID=Q8TSS9_METAC|nr:predicted protein [Methanosarcina acetivorans C2A]